MEKLSFLSSATSPDGYSKIEAGSPRNDQKATQNVEKRAIRALFATLWCLGARSVHYLQHFAALMRDPYAIYSISGAHDRPTGRTSAFRGPDSRSVHYLQHFVALIRDPYPICSILEPWNPVLDGIRGPHSLLRKERHWSCYLLKPNCKNSKLLKEFETSSNTRMG